MSRFQVGESVRNQATAWPPNSNGGGGRDRGSKTVGSGSGDRVSVESLGGALGELSESKPSDPTTLAGVTEVLDRKILDVLHKSEIPQPDISELIDANGDFHVPGTEEWLEHGRKTGVFFRLPKSLGDLLHAMRDEVDLNPELDTPEKLNRAIAGILAGANWDEASKDLNSIRSVLFNEGAGDDDKASIGFLVSVVDQIQRMNDLMGKIAANHPDDGEKLIELGRAVWGSVQPKNPEDDFTDGHNDYRQFMADPQNFFRFALRSLHYTDGDGKSELLEGINDRSRRHAYAAAQSFGDGGISALREEAKELELEVFDDANQAEIEIGFAILEVLEDYGSVRMGSSRSEQAAFDAYLNGIRAHADTEEGRADMHQKLTDRYGPPDDG